MYINAIKNCGAPLLGLANIYYAIYKLTPLYEIPLSD